MNPRLPLMLVAAGMCLVFITIEAAAWGPRARQAITMAALQSIRQRHADAFKADASDYQIDLVRGAEAGIGILRDTLPMNNDAQTLAAVEHEIQLLRVVREQGTGSYFAYRMGVLGALVSEIILPYGVPFSEAEQRVKEAVDSDLEQMINRFVYTPKREGYTYVRAVPQYFQSKRQFYANDLKLIADDYAHGRTGSRFLAEAGQTYFNRAVESVTDIWFTVLYHGSDTQSISPSITARYYVNEIAYLINEKRNLLQADRAYRIFRELDPGMREAYETIGDLFYAFGTPDARERGVKEWQIAYSQPGPQRQRASAKLGQHFIEQGDAMYRKSRGPNATNTDLEEALRSFEQALMFDRNNDVAAARIKETTEAIKARREKYEFLNNVINNALAVTKEAERARLDNNFAVSIHTYNQAVNLLEVVDSEFRDLEALANETKTSINRAIKAIYEEVLTRAEILIEDGDRAVDERRFEEAIASYNMVEQVLDAIPAAEGTLMADTKNDVVERSLIKIDDAKLAQKRFQDDQAAAAAPPAAPGRSPFN